MPDTVQSSESAKSELVSIFILGKKYDVPSSLTIQKAMEYAGYQLVRGCGCRGGICGACGTIYRFPNDFRLHFGLACQTVVEPNMYITQIPFFPGNKASYDIEAIEATGEELLRQPWMGRRPTVADTLPVIGPAPRHEGLWLAFAHSHMGLTMGPITGQLIANFISDSSQPFPVDPCAPSRYL